MQGRQKLQNLRCKRRRSLLKKSIELTKNFGTNMLVIMQDKDNGKFFQYASGDKESGLFTLDKVQQELRSLDANGGTIKVYGDEDYRNLIAQKTDDDQQELETQNTLKQKKKREAGQQKNVKEVTGVVDTAAPSEKNSGGQVLNEVSQDAQGLPDGPNTEQVNDKPPDSAQDDDFQGQF